MIAAIVLAGGASERMGSPKALLRFRDATFLKTILDAALAVGLAPRVVVLGFESDKILRYIDLSDVLVATTSNPAAGPIASIQTGIEAVLNHAVDGAVLWHVDQPHVRLETLRVLVDTFRARAGSILVPTYRGKRGHPILIGRPVFGELWDEASETEGARAVVRRDPGRVIEVPTDDPAILEDIDTPEDYRRLLNSSTKFLN